MKHKLKISVSKQPQTGGIVTCKNLTVRERLLRFLFGDKCRVTVEGAAVTLCLICHNLSPESVKLPVIKPTRQARESTQPRRCFY